MSLESWLQIGHLTKHEATVAEVSKLLGVVDRELADASVADLSDDGRFTHAYDAALILCKLALHASGFEVQKRAAGHHALWINSLELTLGAAHKDTLIHLSKFPNCGTPVSTTTPGSSRDRTPMTCWQQLANFART